MKGVGQKFGVHLLCTHKSSLTETSVLFLSVQNFVFNHLATFVVSCSLDPDQNVGPDLYPNYLTL